MVVCNESPLRGPGEPPTGGSGEEQRPHWNFKKVSLVAGEALPSGRGQGWGGPCGKDAVAEILLKHHGGEMQGVKFMFKGV